MKNSELDLGYSEKVTNKFIQLCNEGTISYHDELRFISYIENKYKPVTIQEYSKLTNRNHKLINNDFESGKLSDIIFGAKKFIYSLF